MGHCGLRAQRESKLSEFHRLIEQQIPRLRRYARALTRNRERADDLVQDTLGRALSKEQFWHLALILGLGCSRSCTTRTLITFGEMFENPERLI